MGGEVPEQVCPAELALLGVEVVVGAPAIRAGDAGEILAEQRPDLTLVTAGGDPEQRCPLGQSAPERAPLARRPPAGLVDVDDRGRADLLRKPSLRLCERLAHMLHDRVERPGRKLDSEQLAHQLGAVAAGDAVANRERRDGRLQARPEGAMWHVGRQLGTRLGSTGRAAQPMQTVLGHGDRDRRQLTHLVALRASRLDALALAEPTSAVGAACRPMLNHLTHPLQRKQPPAPALMPGLAAAPAPARRLPRPRRRRRRILGGRQRRIARAPVETPLQLGDAGLQPPIRLDQLANPHQQRDRRLPITVENPLRLSPLHTPQFATPKRVPSGQVNAYHFLKHVGYRRVEHAREAGWSPMTHDQPCALTLAQSHSLTDLAYKQDSLSTER